MLHLLECVLFGLSDKSLNSYRVGCYLIPFDTAWLWSILPIERRAAVSLTA